ncbi:hypothetical protein VTN96DRAFT_5843 [Rasamsonia emersonii]
MHLSSLSALLSLSLFPLLTAAQLSGSVGPLTSISHKKGIKTCNVLNYGAVADNSTDLGPPLTAAFTACASGGLVYIPPGNYALNTWVTLSGGTTWALQLDGVIYRTGTSGGNMIYIEHATDFELFSSTSAGAVQGSGYLYHVNGDITGPRILRLYEVSDFSVHNIALTDSPSFHFSMDTCSNGEVYNMAIRGGDEGGLDGIDVWGTNIWIHDVEVTNKDECVTVKSPASNILVQNIYCNRSGGCAIGSLGAGVNVSDIMYTNVYTWASNQMMMIKSNGGSGTLSNVVFENFIGHGNAYSLNIDSHWSGMTPVSGNGVQLNNITFTNWKGTEANGATRGPVKVICPDAVPCTDIVIEDFAMWTETGNTQWLVCESAYGSGFCLDSSSDHTSYAAVTQWQTTPPSGYSAPTMAADLTAGFGTTQPIPIPTIPTSFYPGVTPISR